MRCRLEAVRADGRRLGFGRRRVTRVSAAGSLFAGGARVFEAAASGQGAGRVALVERQVSALAVPLRFPFVVEDGWRACGVAGWAGFMPAACAGAAEVVLFPDGDRDGWRAVARLAETLCVQARTVWVSDAPNGLDVADPVGLVRAERVEAAKRWLKTNAAWRTCWIRLRR